MEVEWGSGGENSDIFGEIAIIRIVETVCRFRQLAVANLSKKLAIYKVSSQHFDSLWSLSAHFELLERDSRVSSIVFHLVRWEYLRSLLPIALSSCIEIVKRFVFPCGSVPSPLRGIEIYSSSGDPSPEPRAYIVGEETSENPSQQLSLHSVPDCLSTKL